MVSVSWTSGHGTVARTHLSTELDGGQQLTGQHLADQDVHEANGIRVEHLNRHQQRVIMAIII